VNLDIKRVVAYRHWCNKLWNAIKFGMLRLGEGFEPAAVARVDGSTPLEAKWILTRLARTAGGADGSRGWGEVQRARGERQRLRLGAAFRLTPRALATLTSPPCLAAVNLAMDAYDFAGTTHLIHSFWQDDVCDYYIELIKPVMQVLKGKTQSVTWRPTRCLLAHTSLNPRPRPSSPSG